jgi:O-antigen ligase
VKLLPATVPGRVAQRSARDSLAGQLVLVVVASLGAGLLMAATGDIKIPLGLVAFATLGVLGFVRPALFVGLFLATRPLLDAFSDKQFVHGLASANPAGLLAVLMISMTLVALTTSGNLFVPRGVTALVLVIALSAFGAAWAMVKLGREVGTEPISELVRLTAMLAIYLLAANLFGTPRRTRLLATTLALSAVPPAVIGLVQWINGVRPVPGFTVGRIDSTFVGPNPFGAYLATSALLLIAGTPQLPRRVRLPSLAVVLAALVGTYSREGWIIFLVGIVLLGWRRHRLQVLAVAVAVTLLALTVPAVHERVLPSNNRTVLPSGVSQKATFESFTWRVGNWAKLLAKYKDSPVIGYGLRSTRYVNPRRQGIIGAAGAGFEAHNLAIRALVEGGVVLLAAYALAFVVLVRDASRMARARWPLQQLARVVLALWVLVIVVGLSTDDPFSNTTMMFALLALAGSLEGACQASHPQAALKAHR